MERDEFEGHILITGGTGFIGSYLSHELMQIGYRVTTVSRRSCGNENHVCADLTDRIAVADIAKNLTSVDTIIHCAAIAHGESPPKNYSVSGFNTAISNNLLDAFGKYKIRWIFISSISVYGDQHSDVCVPISLDPKPSDSYGLGKLSDERRFIESCDHLNILRLMPVYDNANMQDIRKRVFLPALKVKVLITPNPTYSICSVKNVAAVVAECMKYNCGQRIFQVGDSQPVRQRDLMSQFPGGYIIIPQFLFRCSLRLLPKRITFFRHLRFMFKKLGLNNIYEVGVMHIE